MGLHARFPNGDALNYRGSGSCDHSVALKATASRGTHEMTSSYVMPRTPDPGASESTQRTSALDKQKAKLQIRTSMQKKAAFPFRLKTTVPCGGIYGFEPSAVLSCRARVSPHVLVSYERNTGSITAGELTTGVKGSVPSDFVYAAGADAWVTRWLTGNFDIVEQRAQTVSITRQPFLANYRSCTASPNPSTVAQPSLATSANSSYNLTNTSMVIKVRPLGKASRRVFTENVLVRRGAQVKACTPRRRGLHFLDESVGFVPGCPCAACGQRRVGLF
jgi:hypothetical protein